MINESPPKNWQDLQNEVAQIIRESSLVAEVEKKIETVRGSVNIDVYAEDKTQKPPVIYLCECKHWRGAVPKAVVHAFRTVVADYGANWGLIISSAGFQAGAHEAARNSNIRLLNWQEFEELFEDRWFREHMVKQIQLEAGPLIEYTEPINSRIFRKADALSGKAKKKFISLRQKYSDLANVSLFSCTGIFKNKPNKPKLPLKDALGPMLEMEEVCIPKDLLEATSLRAFLEILLKHTKPAVHDFDEVFGERA